MKTEAKSSIDVFEGAECPTRNRRLFDFSKMVRERRPARAESRRSTTPSIFVIQKPATQEQVKGQFRALADGLCAEHSAISTDNEVLGGTPHIKNTRLSVGTVLGKLYVYGSIAALLENYGPRLSEEQVKAAIAYAQDFLEIACDPHEAP